MRRVSSRIGASSSKRLRRSTTGTAPPPYCTTPSRNSGACGQAGGLLVSQDPLDLQDVEGELLEAHPEGHDLDVVSLIHEVAVSEKRAPTAVRSSRGMMPVRLPHHGHGEGQ